MTFQGHTGNRIVAEAAKSMSWGGRTRVPRPGEVTQQSPLADISSDKIQSEIINILSGGLQERVLTELDVKVGDAAADIINYLDKVKAQISAVKMQSIVVKTETSSTEFLGLRHKQFEKLLRVVARGFATMMVGTAGSGKTFAAEQVAKALELSFYAMSVGSQTSKSDIIGFKDAHGQYHRTMFREAYEHGGVFLMDEIDAGNANVLIILNAALAGHSCAFPDAMVPKHKDFRFISTANTFGTGASRQYVGRNQIDAATLDRFVAIEWLVDTTLEANLVKDLTNGSRWHKVVTDVRKYVTDGGHRVVVSPRATLKGATLLDDGFDLREVIDMVLLPTAPTDQQKAIRDLAIASWGGYANV